jgi:hypothetical protein
VDKVPDATNVALGALVFGQFLGDATFSISVAVIGAAIWLFCMGCAFVLARGGRS